METKQIKIWEIKRNLKDQRVVIALNAEQLFLSQIVGVGADAKGVRLMLDKQNKIKI